jgi:hypothetical protein
MARSSFNALITEKSLRIYNGHDTAEFVTHAAEELGLKNVCARVHPQLAERIDEIVGLLGISKRRFLEAAFIEAVDQAEQIMEEEGVYDRIGQAGTVEVPNPLAEEAK